jgi:hypothetical protein
MRHFSMPRLLGVGVVLVAVVLVTIFFLPSKKIYTTQYGSENHTTEEASAHEESPMLVSPEVTSLEAEHIVTPEAVRAVYMSSWVASTKNLRDNIVAMIDETELNAVVIDIKDSTGKVSFLVEDEILKTYGSSENRIKDIQVFIEELHEKDIYVIGRISVFQDPYLSVSRPDLAVTRKSDGGVWKDRKGLSFLHPLEKEVWDYTIALARESHRIGFDEINFDYIRFPSDGNINDINYRLAEGQTRADALETFFAYLHGALTKDGIISSADLFGMTTTDMTTDLGIGQVLEQAMPYFDYIAPMVYPSHYPAGWNGYAEPAKNPYDIISLSMKGAVERAIAAGFDADKMRPWLQDFNLGATYTSDMVRKQIEATYDQGMDSWMMWDPGNSYTKSAFKKDIETMVQ